MTVSQAGATAEEGAAAPRRSRTTVVFGTVLLGVLLAALDQTVVSTALPTIVADLGGTSHLSWMVTAYLLAQTVSVALAGKFGDLFGRKWVFQASATVFMIGSMLCGLAPSLAGTSVAQAHAATDPQMLRMLSEPAHGVIVTAYAQTVDTMFLSVAPVALIGLVLALLPKQVPMRGGVPDGAMDVGSGFAMPQARTISAGNLGSDGDRLWLTDTGEREIGKIITTQRAWLNDRLHGGHPTAPPTRAR